MEYRLLVEDSFQKNDPGKYSTVRSEVFNTETVPELSINEVYYKNMKIFGSELEI